MGTYVTEGAIGAALDSVGGRGNQLTSLEVIAQLFNEAITSAGDGAYDGSPARVAALIGQCAQESAWFRTTTEYSAGSNRYSPYDGRTFIQITWADNYRAFGQWCANRGLIDDAAYFVNNPTSLSDLKWAALGGVWYFAARGILPYADAKDWTAVGGIINTGSATGVPGGNATRLKACQAAYDYLIQNKIGGTSVPSAMQLAVAQAMVDYIGKFAYSQQDRYDNATTDGDGMSADCSSLVQMVYRDTAGIDVGSYTDAQAARGVPVFGVDLESVETAIALLQPGDLVLVKHYVPAGSAYWDHVEMYIGNAQTCGHGGPGAGPQIHDFRTMWNQEKELIARRYLDSGTTEEDDFMSTEAVELLRQISSQTLTTADALTVGKEGVKFDGDIIARLRAIEEKLDKLGTGTVPDSSTPTDPTVPVVGTEAIRSAVAAARAALDTIEAQL